ncbi:MAG: Rap1a/Tai family immunity protein [Rhodovibrionaceae bacterium]|nr:Rap1a/Tai family immunity protein [Rhodovibrionaceae bacterium]
MTFDSGSLIRVLGLSVLCWLSASQWAAAADRDRPLSAASLAADCRVVSGASHLFCLGYIRGIVEMQSLLPESERHFCAPTLDPATRRRVFREWYSGNQATAKNQTAAEVVVDAFRARYPCPD